MSAGPFNCSAACIAFADEPDFNLCTDSCDAEFTVVPSLLVAVVLVCLSGMFSGLTLGLLSLTMEGLDIVINGGDADEAKWANRIRPLRKRGNLLLCTLLLGNTLVNAVLSILLAGLTTGLAGSLISTGVIVIFGEIIPQSYRRRARTRRVRHSDGTRTRRVCRCAAQRPARASRRGQGVLPPRPAHRRRLDLDRQAAHGPLPPHHAPHRHDTRPRPRT